MSETNDARSSGEVEQRSYTGERDDWGIDDPKVGPGVPLSVRQGGATGPMLKKELAGNGTSYRGAPANYECEECGSVRRFVTSDWNTMYHCRECGGTRWFVVAGIKVDQ